jgi:hypothetical protein
MSPNRKATPLNTYSHLRGGVRPLLIFFSLNGVASSQYNDEVLKTGFMRKNDQKLERTESNQYSSVRVQATDGQTTL